jgi:hypothetical protein
MSVYVDDMKAGFGRMIMCHMIADTPDELMAMADRIGVARKWLQCAGTPKEHFDICLAKRARAVSFGAVEVTQMALAKRIDETLWLHPARQHEGATPMSEAHGQRTGSERRGMK